MSAKAWYSSMSINYLQKMKWGLTDMGIACSEVCIIIQKRRFWRKKILIFKNLKGYEVEETSDSLMLL